MNIFFQISSITFIFWLLLVIRHRKSEYMPYFLILTFGIPLTISFLYLHHTAMNSFFMISLLHRDPVLFYTVAWWGTSSQPTHLLISLLAFFAIQKLEFISHNFLLNIIMICLTMTGIILADIGPAIFIFIQIIIMYKLLQRTFLYSKHYNKINVFDFIMVLFSISVIMEFFLGIAEISFLADYASGAEIFRSILAIYLSIFSYNSKYTFINLPDYSAGRT